MTKKKSTILIRNILILIFYPLILLALFPIILALTMVYWAGFLLGLLATLPFLGIYCYLKKISFCLEVFFILGRNVDLTKMTWSAVFNFKK